MRAVRFVLPAGASVTLTPWHGLGALALLASLLVFGAYVQLLHGAVERGDRFRAQALPEPVARAAPARLDAIGPRSPRRWVAAADFADATDTASR